MKLLIFLLLVALFAATAAAQELSIEPVSPRLGEQLTVTTSFNMSEVKLFIDTPTNTYHFIGTGPVMFTPLETGVHSVTLLNASDARVLSVRNFTVREPGGPAESAEPADVPIAEASAAMYPLQDTYSLHDVVVLRLNFTPQSTHRLEIASATTHYDFLGVPDFTVFFYPQELGVHTARILDGDTVIFATTFLVVSELNSSIEQVQRYSWNIMVRDQQDHIFPAKVRIFDEQNNLVTEVRKEGLNKVHTAAIVRPERFEVEVLPETSPVERMLFRDVPSATPGIDVGIANVSVDTLGKGRDWKVAYSIDPTTLDFSAAEVTATAIGSELYKCILWDFSLQRCNGTWEKIMDIVPGKPYTFLLTPEDPGYAETGVASVNTNKSVYHPEEPAGIIMVVLDTGGYLVPDANVTLTVTAPNNESFVFNTSSGSIVESSRGIYETTFIDTSLQGNYTIAVEATAQNVNSSLLSQFSVQDYYPFEIARNTPVAFDPFTSSFSSGITVTSYANTSLFNITEILPLNFTVLDGGGAFVRVKDERILLTWFNLSNGSSVGYEATAPLITPELYQLGKIIVQYGNSIYEEARGWFLAVDPPGPHNIAGRVFHEGTNGVNNGYPVRVNNTATGVVEDGLVFAPPLPAFKGSYLLTINGNDGDGVLVYSWNETALGNGSGVLGSSATYINITLNQSRPPEPNVTILAPPDGSFVGIAVPFNVTVNISMQGVNGVGCTATISFSNASAVNITETESLSHSIGSLSWPQFTSTTWNVTGRNFTASDISVRAACANTGILFENTSSDTVFNITVLDDVAPFVQVDNSTNATWVNIVNHSLYYNVSDYSPLSNCSLFWDSVLNSTQQQPPRDTQLFFTINSTDEGMHTWSVQCLQNATLGMLGNSTNITLGVDITAPNLTVILPKNGSLINTSAVTFTFNTSDALAGVRNCSVLLDGSTIFTNTSITAQENNHTLQLPAGNHSFVVSCFDFASNQNISGPRFINITAPDLEVREGLITFTPAVPIEAQEVSVNATILNSGNRDANDTLVQFFLGLPALNDQLGNYTVNITPGGNITLNVSWIAEPGNHTFSVVADPPTTTNGSIFEFNESNNEDFAFVFISAYQLFYGELVANVFLTDSINVSLSSQLNGSFSTGHIFIADSDSAISFLNLTALGRAANQSVAPDDFVQLDAALNLSALPDSLNLTYTLNGQPRQLRNYSLFTLDVQNVPIHNATATAFATGMVWDSDDENDGEFNATQDVLFLTEVLANTPGGYGVYDYELEVPAFVRSYKKPDLASTLTFYIELR